MVNSVLPKACPMRYEQKTMSACVAGLAQRIQNTKHILGGENELGLPKACAM